MEHRNLFARTLTLAAALAALFAAAPAGAGFPGNDFLKQDEQATYRHVCINAPQTQCVDVDDFDSLFTGTECSPQAPESCAVDLVPDKQIRGVLTLIADDVDPTVPFDNIRTASMLEFQIGDELFVIADTFPEGQQIGSWNPIQGENAIFEVGFGGGALFKGNLGPFKTRIEEIAAAKLGVDTNATDPVMVEGLSLSPTPTGTPKTPPGFEDPNAHDDGPLAKVARYRVTIRFAKRL